ncbi:MAG: hypothetical protein ACMUIS_07475 [bacterium]
MDETLQNLDHLDPWVREHVVPFCHHILQSFPGRICSICLYGSAAVGDYIHKRSNINLMIMIDALHLEDLQTLLHLMKRARKKGIAAPLLLTPEHIATSTDAFPIEFLDMKEKHVNLYGTDPFIDLDIDLKNLRLQCEQQIKGKLIRLRQSYMELGLKKRPLAALLTASLTSLLPVLRNTIRLVQPTQQPPRSNEEIILRACKDFQLDNEVFLDILKLKKGHTKPDMGMITCIFEGYLDNLTTLAKHIDQIKVDCISVEDPDAA